jgi:hypothetical protein
MPGQQRVNAKGCIVTAGAKMAVGSYPFRLVLVVAAFAIALGQQQGLSYVRWGVSSCPSSASLIYSGYTAGSGASSGGGANFLCLPSDPQYLPGSFSGASNSGADVSRVEYMTLRSGVPSLVGLHGMEVPCALCARQVGPTSIVIPGQTSCPAGLTADYAGYLMAPPSNRPRAEAICLDQNAVGIGSSSQDGWALLSPVEVGTGTATPLNYNQGFEITCVRCSGNSTSGSLYTRFVLFVSWAVSSRSKISLASHVGYRASPSFKYRAPLCEEKKMETCSHGCGCVG